MMSAIANESLVNFESFLDWYPENTVNRYELHQGVIFSMPKPRGKHSEIAGFLMTELSLEIRRLNLPYFIPRESLVKGDELSAYEPDVIILADEVVNKEPLWEKASTIISGQSIPLIIEVVSSNWSDDYALKLDVYETLGIKEYWIVDYLGIGGHKFIGFPKEPTLSIFSLENSEYQGVQFRKNQVIKSLTFPELNLTANQIFNCGK